MSASRILTDAFDRIHSTVHDVADDLDAEALSWRPERDANSIVWLIWHLTRIQDDHIAEVAGREQVWRSQDWVTRFGLPFAATDTGYGHTSAQVAQVEVGGPAILTGYHDAVREQALDYLRGLRDENLDMVVDTSWDPPVTLGVRLVSVVADNLQHVGQAAFVRGIVQRR